MSNTPHSADVRARALAALLTGERPVVVARNLGVPEATVRIWKHRLKSGKVKRIKKGAVGALLMDYLEASLMSLMAQSKQLAEPERIRELRAGEAAALVATIFERTVRVLELAPALGLGPGKDETERRSRWYDVT